MPEPVGVELVEARPDVVGAAQLAAVRGQQQPGALGDGEGVREVLGPPAPFARRIGKRTVDEIDASQGRLGGRGSAQAGYILGLIGTVLLGLGLLVLVGILVLTIVGTVSSSTTTY